ncbi:hypothetical protein HDA40_006116 [Hamadaea flava]|uniref:Uncharacterized protein n=1 Tax=Hamadaea flava TaxID=1742688 RepID=A0ABV8LVZ0_9ACTN|nr:hypothetical protein [Hamadaea flava]MCP2327609.1 hypothetical protein [Hamadaea flava]
MSQHPAWCDRQGCAERAEHRSADVRANTVEGDEIQLRVTDPGAPRQDPADVELYIVRARLVAQIHDGRTLPPSVELLTYEEPAEADGRSALLTVRQTSMLSTGLSDLVALAGGAA